MDNAAHLLNVAPAGFASFRDDGTIVAVNDTLLDLLGYARDELLGSHFERILGVPGRIFFQTHLFPLVRMQGWAEEIYVVLRSNGGERIPVLLNARRVESVGSAVTHCVVIQVKERQKFEDELLRAKKAAEEAHARERAAHEAKTHYLLSVSHELRTPLNALVGYTELLALTIGKATGDPQLRYTERARHAAHHLLHIVNDVLDLAKIESGAMSVEVKPAELDATIADALEMVAPQAKERDVDLVTVGDAPAGYMGDRHRMVQVLLNLLSNGVKFSDPGETVEIGWGRADAPDPAAELDRAAGPWLRIQVSDSGPGIPRDRLGDLFRPFSQIRERDARTGSGLGLAISREFVRLMGGDITVESEPGVGSTFTVWLMVAS